MVMKPRPFNSAGFGRARPAAFAGTYQAGRDQRLAARAARAMGEVTPRASVMACASAPAAPVPKAELLESEPYRRAVAALRCMWCGIEGFSQHAHLNLGKGLSLKTDDRTGFPLCSTRPGVEGCHTAYDQYRLVPGGREGHRAYGLEWGRITRATILDSGQWPPRLPAWAPEPK